MELEYNCIQVIQSLLLDYTDPLLEYQRTLLSVFFT
jgi:hypothetical protein